MDLFPAIASPCDYRFHRLCCIDRQLASRCSLKGYQFLQTDSPKQEVCLKLLNDEQSILQSER
jgi:hypothetical protein